MNELQFSRQVRQRLDESTARLPYKVVHRLEQARVAALSRVPATKSALSAEPSTGLSTGLTVSGSGQAALSGQAPEPGPSFWKKTLLGVLPVLIVAAGLFAISEWSDRELADEADDVDAAMLEDEVPLSAYADRGFGVFLKNTGQ